MDNIIIKFILANFEYKYVCENEFILANFEYKYVCENEFIYDKFLKRNIYATDLLIMMNKLFNLTDYETKVYFTRVFTNLDRYWTNMAWCDILPIGVTPMVIGDDFTPNVTMLNRYSLQELNERLYKTIRLDSID